MVFAGSDMIRRDLVCAFYECIVNVVTINFHIWQTDQTFWDRVTRSEWFVYTANN